MTFPTDEAFSKALSTFNHFAGGRYDPEDSNLLDRHFGSIAECVIGDSLSNLRKPLFELSQFADNDGFVVHNGVRLRFTSGVSLMDELPLLDVFVYENDAPQFRYVITEETNWQGTTYQQFSVREVDPTDPEYPYTAAVGSADIWEKSEDLPSRSTGHGTIHNFSKFVRAMRLVLPLINPSDIPRYDYKDMDTLISRGKHINYDGIMKIDLGLAGTAALSVAETIQNVVFKKVMNWAKDVIPALHRVQKEEGFVWGEKYLVANDLDDRICMIPTDDNRKAVFHQNISLIAPHNAYIASATVDAEGVTRVDVFALQPSDNIYQSVKDFQDGTLAIAPVVTYDVKTAKLDVPAGIEETRILQTMAFSMNWDKEMFLDGGEGHYSKMRDASQETDFENAFMSQDSDEENDNKEGFRL